MKFPRILQIAILFCLMLFVTTSAEAQVKKNKELTVETSIQCQMCVDRLEDAFAHFWAVKRVEYNLDEQEVQVTYNKKKTSPQEIREFISAVGYDADDVEAEADAYEALPACCKKGFHIPED